MKYLWCKLYPEGRLKTGSQNLENLEKQNKLVHGVKKRPLSYVS